MTEQTFDQTEREIYVASVSVATVWTDPSSARAIDELAISNPANVDEWVNQLDDTQKLALCDENRIQTQLLYGERVMVTKRTGDWAHIVIPSQPSRKDNRGYPGWVPACQIKKMNIADWQQPVKAVIRSSFAWLTFDHQAAISLSYLTILPVKAHHEDAVTVITPHGIGYVDTNDVELFSNIDGVRYGNGEAIVAVAKKYVGLEYFWGGMSTLGFDCSGLAYAAHKANGYQIARDAGDQATAGIEVPLEKLRPGDLLFFAYEEEKGRIHHVGIYSGDGTMLHAPQTGKGIEKISIANTIYETELCTARRYWREGGTVQNGESNPRSESSAEVF
ncbi:C40 family peptidase [Virgibacillus pantothenticus]|uniref:C40 family peptidase n=1 Tax=Virgibacillus pantothenticus TaxID=1473 RepID=UPI0025B1D6F1|nr:C40 family peptidase [Virgibacillus pantothenticus]